MYLKLSTNNLPNLLEIYNVKVICPNNLFCRGNLNLNHKTYFDPGCQQGPYFAIADAYKTGFRCSLPMEFGVKMSNFEASKKRNATTGKLKNIF